MTNTHLPGGYDIATDPDFHFMFKTDEGYINSAHVSGVLKDLTATVNSHYLPLDLVSSREKWLRCIREVEAILATINAAVTRDARAAEIARLKARITELEALP